MSGPTTVPTIAQISTDESFAIDSLCPTPAQSS